MKQISTNCFKVDKPNYIALTEGFSVNGSQYKQSIWCDVEQKLFPMLLTMQKSKVRKDYPLNKNCKSFDKTQDFSTFNDLYRPTNFQYKYIAEFVNQYFIENKKNFWEIICNNGLFDIWSPEAPLNRFANCKSPVFKFRIILLRVYEIENPISYTEINRDLRLTDRFLNYSKLNVKIKRAVIGDEQFLQLKNKLDKSINDYRTDTIRPKRIRI